MLFPGVLIKWWLHCQNTSAVIWPVAKGFSSSVVILKTYWILLSETHSQQERQWLHCPWRQWRFGYWKAGFGSLTVYPEFSPRALLLLFFPPKNNIKAGVRVLRWQCSNLPKNYSKTQIMCAQYYVLQGGKLEQIKKGKFNLGCVRT